MRERIQKILNKLLHFFGSKYFFWVIIVLFVLQSMWIAFSSGFGMPYDESFHFGVIKIFGAQWFPFITSQPHSYDIYGNLAHGDATLFHYFMSFPYRIITAFTHNLAVQVISLRLICIAMVAVGIALYNKLFQKIGIKRIFINFGMLIFVLLPIVIFLAATINYDNMLLPLTALFFIVCVDIISSKKVVWTQYLWLVIIGCFASLVKYTFLPIFAIGVVYLLVVLYRRYGKNIFSKITKSFQSTDKIKRAGIISLAIITIGMFSAVYLQNIIVYRSIKPSCEKVMSEKRCAKNAVYAKYFTPKARALRSGRPLVQIPNYITPWVLQMESWTTMMGGGGSDGLSAPLRKPLPIFFTTVFVGSFIGLLALFYAWKSLPKKPSWYFLIAMSAALTLIVFLQNYSMYADLHVMAAIQPRYLLGIIPIILVMAVVAINHILKNKIYLKVVILLIVLLLFTQGGGIITYISQSRKFWYWQNSNVINANVTAKKIILPFVKDN